MPYFSTTLNKSHWLTDSIISKDKLKWILLVTLSCIWGSSFILIKKGLEHFSYLHAASIRLCSAGMILLPFALTQIKLIPSKKRKFVAFSGLLAMFIPAYLFCFAQQYVNSSLAGIMNALTPTFTFLISLLLFKTRYATLQFFGLVIGLIGSIYLTLITKGNALTFNPYAWMIVVATFCYGLNINIVKHYLHGVKPWAVSTCSVAFAGICAGIFVLIPTAKSFSIQSDSIYSFLALVLLGLLGTATAIILHNELIKISSAIFASANTYLIPIVAIAWGLLDSEVITLYHLIGVAIIMIAIICIRAQPKFIVK
jgi:drug/metabolite transporter (DMT)-like permease